MEHVVVKFQIAGFRTEVVCKDRTALGNICGYYHEYPYEDSAAPEHLRVELTTNAELYERPADPDYPAFTGSPIPGGVKVERADAIGTIDVTEKIIVAKFQVSPHPRSVEAAIRLAIAIAVPHFGGLLVHSSCVADHRGAYLFCGVSGQGKSTIAKLLGGPDALVKNLLVLSDELTLIMRNGDGVFSAYVTPFIGRESLPLREGRVLMGIHLLSQAPDNRLIPVSGGTLLAQFSRHILAYVADPVTAGAVLETTASLLREVHCFQLEFRKHPDVALVLGFSQNQSAPDFFAPSQKAVVVS